jgi:hypothetical protein
VSFRARRRSLALGVVVAVGVVVAGCTGGGEPVPSPSAEESVEPSPTETPEPEPTETGPVKPERPAAMDRTDGEGAAAAAEYFLDLYPYVMATGDTTEWDAMTWDETCGFCTGVRADAVEVATNGEAFTGGELTLTNGDIGELDTFVNAYPILYDYAQAPHLRLAADGTVVSEGDGSSGRFQIDMSNNGGNWTVLAVGTVE